MLKSKFFVLNDDLARFVNKYNIAKDDILIIVYTDGGYVLFYYVEE
jgi:hypothetical protein